MNSIKHVVNPTGICRPSLTLVMVQRTGILSLPVQPTTKYASTCFLRSDTLMVKFYCHITLVVYHTMKFFV